MCDHNSNGIQDAGEEVVAAVTVKLIGGGADGLVNGVGDVVLATTMTNASGLYSFMGLVAGQYQVQFVAPSGFSFSPKDVGSNDAIDSDADLVTGKSQVICSRSKTSMSPALPATCLRMSATRCGGARTETAGKTAAKTGLAAAP
jgi:hypothetical protein